jgi:hypothetical protein
MLPLVVAAGVMWAAGVIPTLLISMTSKVDRAKRSYDEYMESEAFFKAYSESDAYKAAKKQQRESAAALSADQRNVLSQYDVLKEDFTKLEAAAMAAQSEVPASAGESSGGPVRLKGHDADFAGKKRKDLHAQHMNAEKHYQAHKGAEAELAEATSLVPAGEEHQALRSRLTAASDMCAAGAQFASECAENLLMVLATGSWGIIKQIRTDSKIFDDEKTQADFESLLKQSQSRGGSKSGTSGGGSRGAGGRGPSGNFSGNKRYSEPPAHFRPSGPPQQQQLAYPQAFQGQQGLGVMMGGMPGPQMPMYVQQPPPPPRYAIAPAAVFPGKCHKCGANGHWSRDCPN